MFADVSRQRLAAVLLTALTFLPFLSPFHYRPLPQWWGEISVVFLAGLAILLLPVRASVLPRISWLMLLLALVWAVQPAFVQVAFPGMNYATALAFASLGLVAAGIRRWQAISSPVVVMAWLAWGLLGGALLQSLIGVLQMIDLARHFAGVVFYDPSHPTSNIFGHLGQRNQYAHYLSWGMVALAWLAAQRRIHSGLAVVLLLWLGLSVAFAGSRTALLYGAMLFLLAPLWHWRVGGNDSRRMLIWLLAAAVAIWLMQFAAPLLHWLLAQFGLGSPTATGVERLAANADGMGARRMAEWGKAWLAFRDQPWFGVGWSQYAYESVRLHMLPQFINSGINSGLFSNAHNLLFQLLAEVGLIGTGALVLGLVWVLLPWFSGRAEAWHVLPLGLLGISLLHSMLEYPLWYLYFPAVLVVMLALAPESKVPSTPRQWPLHIPVGLMLLFALYGAVRTVELAQLTRPVTVVKQQRLQQIIQKEPLFAFHAQGMLGGIVRPTSQMDAQQREWSRQWSRVRPYPDALRKEAQFLALEGDQRNAVHTMKMAMASFPTYAPQFLRALDPAVPEWAPLRQVVEEGNPSR